MMLFSSRARGDREAAARLYAAIVRQARQPVFYAQWGVPDTLDGRFEMMALHLFAVTDRLVGGPDRDLDLARAVSETFVSDMDAAFREMGVGDLTVPKRMKTLYRSFAGRMMAYREGLAAGPAAAAAAIERNVFPDGDPRGNAVRLAEYLSATADALSRIRVAELRAGVLPSPPVPAALEEQAR